MTRRIAIALTEIKTTTAALPMMSCCEENAEQSGVSFSGGIPPCSDLVSVFLTHLTQTHTPTHTVLLTVQLFRLAVVIFNSFRSHVL